MTGWTSLIGGSKGADSTTYGEWTIRNSGKASWERIVEYNSISLVVSKMFLNLSFTICWMMTRIWFYGGLSIVITGRYSNIITQKTNSMDWFKGTFTGKPRIFNPQIDGFRWRFSPTNQSIDKPYRFVNEHLTWRVEEALPEVLNFAG